MRNQINKSFQQLIVQLKEEHKEEPYKTLISNLCDICKKEWDQIQEQELLSYYMKALEIIEHLKVANNLLAATAQKREKITSYYIPTDDLKKRYLLCSTNIFLFRNKNATKEMLEAFNCDMDISIECVPSEEYFIKVIEEMEQMSKDIIPNNRVLN